MRVTLVISSLARGGAEKVIVEMANYWAERNHNVTLITLDSSANDFFSVSRKVKRSGLDLLKKSGNLLAAVKNNFLRLFRLRREIKRSQPEIIISFIDRMNILTLLASSGLGARTLVSERTATASHSIGILWSALRRWIYPWADGIVLQTQEVLESFQAFEAQAKLFVIPNPISALKPAEQPELHDVPLQKKILLAVGRLTEEKGFDLLIQAFSKIADDFTDWHLLILGDGPLLSDLKELVFQKKLTAQVSFLGEKKNLPDYYGKADIFVLPSRYEGFPNALLEAMASHLPVVSFDCPSGPRAIIENGVNGVLVPPQDTVALAFSLKALMQSEAERKKLSGQSAQVLDKFALPNVMGLWEAAIQTVRGV